MYFCGECSCHRQWKQPLILERITLRIWKCTRTRTSRKSRVYSVSLRSWYWTILKRFWMCNQLKVQLSLGRDLHCLMIKWSNGQKQKVHVYSDSVLCLGKMSDLSEANRRWEGQVAVFQLSASDEELLGIDGESLNSSGKFSQGLNFCRFFRGSRMICKNGTLNLKNFESELSSCQWSTTSNGQEKETKRTGYLKLRKSQDVREEILPEILDVRRPWRQRIGMKIATTNLRENGMLSLHSGCNDSTKQVTQSSQVPVPWVLESWECQKEKKPYTSMRMLRTHNPHSESCTQ